MHSGGSMLLQKQGKENVFFHEQPYQILVVVITVITHPHRSTTCQLLHYL